MANELATAYLRLIPSLKGAGKTIDAELNSEMKSSGDKSSNAFGGGFKSGISKIAIGNFLGNALTQGATMAVDGLIDVFKGAFEQAATFEQLEGGVQKIFDQANVEQIMADAKSAYVDLNMSANDYLDSINQVGATFAQTMGDQAGYDTARTGMKAIADYASGTGRNLDELNEKYKLITRSTGSYQSIADQFAGILPQTSADFLAQAQAAGLLSEEYTKLTDVPVAEYQQAVTMMLEKGVTDLGLLGNTAAESASTISGSIAMTQAAWSNFLLAIGTGEGLNEAMNNLFTSLEATFNNIAPLIGTMLPAIGEAIGQMIAYIIAHIPDVLMAAGQLILGLVTGICEGLAPTMAAFEEVVNGGLAAIGNFFAQMFEAGANLVQGLINGITSAIGGVADAIMGGLSGAVDGALHFLGIASPSKLFTWVGEMSMAGLVVGTENMTGDVQHAMQGAIDDVYGVARAQADIAISASSNTGELSTLAGMGVYIDGRALIGYIAPGMDTALGRAY